MKTNKVISLLLVFSSLITLSTLSIAATSKASKNVISKKNYSKSLPITKTKEFKVNGIMAWSEAKKNGFQFYPKEHYPGENLDGISAEGYSRKTYDKKKCTTPSSIRSQVVGGVNMILNQCRELTVARNSYAHFRIFWNKKLKPGWKIKRIKIAGSFQWTSSKWRSNTDSIATEIKLTNSDRQKNATTARIDEITLIGPANGKWQDAFDTM